MLNLTGSVLPVLETSSNLELPGARYFLPIALAALVVMFVMWRLQRREWERACESLKQAKNATQQLERERNMAQDELFRRLFEDRELN